MPPAEAQDTGQQGSDNGVGFSWIVDPSCKLDAFQHDTNYIEQAWQQINSTAGSSLNGSQPVTQCQSSGTSGEYQLVGSRHCTETSCGRCLQGPVQHAPAPTGSTSCRDVAAAAIAATASFSGPVKQDPSGMWHNGATRASCSLAASSPSPAPNPCAPAPPSRLRPEPWKGGRGPRGDPHV
jgi:hypothetical protein